MPLPSTGTLTDAGRDNTAARLIVLTILVLGMLFVAAAATPTSILPRGEIRHAVHDRRLDLALFGLATLGSIGVMYLVVHVAS